MGGGKGRERLVGVHRDLGGGRCYGGEGGGMREWWAGWRRGDGS